MAYESVKNQIDAYIKANGVNLITGPVLNAVLTTMLDELGEGYAFQGVLNTTDTPSPAADIPQAWLAAAGSYLGGSITVDEDELALIIHTADGWSKETVYRGVQLSHDAILDALGYTPADEADLAEKQDTIADLSAIRSGAALGSTSIQPSDIEDMVEAEPIGSIIPPVNPSEFATKEEFSQLSQEVDELTTGVELSVTTPMVISLAGGVGATVPSPSGAAGWGYYDAECSEGAKITVSGTGGNYGLWGFVDANGIILSWSGTQVRETNKEIIAPANTARVIINTYNPGNYPAPKMILPASLIGQIETLASEIEGVGAEIGNLLVEKTVSPTVVTGKYITESGNIGNNSGYEYVSFDAEAGDIVVASLLASLSIAVISTANSDLSVIMPKVISAAGDHEYRYICTENCKIVISGVTSLLAYRVFSSRIDADIQKAGMQLGTQRVFPEYTINAGEFWTKSGTISSLLGYSRTSGAFLKKGTVVYVYWPGLNNPYISIISEVDEQGNFVRTCLTTPDPNVAGDLKYVVDKDGYYAISNQTRSIYRYKMVYLANGELFFNPPLDSLFLPMQDELPREILRSPSFVGIVHKWGFIGDSLSSGEQAVHNDTTGVLERFDLYDYSWGQRLCSLNSVEGYNFSVGGQTTKGWCNGTNERTWAGAQLQENWKEAYCIALGVNDRVELSPGDADTDINLSDYAQNADTFAGWYAGVIQRLRSVNPKCRIFCITIPYNNQQGYLDNNEVIRAIVPKFSRCYLVDLANYHWTPSGLALNDHLSPAGYQWAAFEINTYIDWIIRNNMDDFADIAWVGTEYSA